MPYKSQYSGQQVETALTEVINVAKTDNAGKFLNITSTGDIGVAEDPAISLAQETAARKAADEEQQKNIASNTSRVSVLENISSPIIFTQRNTDAQVEVTYKDSDNNDVTTTQNTIEIISCIYMPQDYTLTEIGIIYTRDDSESASEDTNERTVYSPTAPPPKLILTNVDSTNILSKKLAVSTEFVYTLGIFNGDDTFVATIDAQVEAEQKVPCIYNDSYVFYDWYIKYTDQLDTEHIKYSDTCVAKYGDGIAYNDDEQYNLLSGNITKNREELDSSINDLTKQLNDLQERYAELWANKTSVDETIASVQAELSKYDSAIDIDTDNGLVSIIAKDTAGTTQYKMTLSSAYLNFNSGTQASSVMTNESLIVNKTQQTELDIDPFILKVRPNKNLILI